MVCAGRCACETISPTLVSAKLKPPCSAFFFVEEVYTTPYCGWTMMSGVRLSCIGSWNFSLISSPAMTSSTNSSLAWLLISAATFAACVWSCSQISAMSSSLMNPQGPLLQLAAMFTACIAAVSAVLAAVRAATRSAKWPGLLILSGLIGDWPCLAVMMISVDGVERVAQHVGGSTRAVDVPTRVTRQACGVGCGRGVDAGGIRCVMGDLLTDADGLVIRAKHRRDTLQRRAVVGHPMNPTDDTERLEVVVLVGADHADGVVQAADVGDLRGVEIIEACP